MESLIHPVASGSASGAWPKGELRHAPISQQLRARWCHEGHGDESNTRALTKGGWQPGTISAR